MTLLLMSRNGCGSTAPLCRILMVPPCSTTKSRPELSFGCSRSRGKLNPEATTCVLTPLGPGELLLVAPQPISKTWSNPRIMLHPEYMRQLATSGSHQSLDADIVQNRSTRNFEQLWLRET